MTILISFLYQAAASSGGMFKIQLGRHIEVDPEEIHVTFNDVRGVGIFIYQKKKILFTV